MKVCLSPRATRDLVKIADDIGPLNPGAARSIGDALSASQKLIADHPGIGRLQKGRDSRKFIVPRYGYLIYDRVIDRDGIVTIRHPSRARIASDA